MKIQEQTINKQNGTSFWTIYFENITNNRISENDWHIINEFIESYLNKIEKSEKPINLISSQTEISDEEILIGLKNSWSDYEYDNGNLYSTTYRDGWVNAIKWYREQLKKKQ